MRCSLIRDLVWELDSMGSVTKQREPEYIEWVNSNSIDIIDEFVQKNKLSESHFIKSMNAIFKTTRFEVLLKRWLVGYLMKLLDTLNGFNDLVLEDNILNRFVVEKYHSRFEILPKIKWRKQSALFYRIYSILIRCAIILYLSLNNGLKIFGKRKKYKVMREALWGLYGVNGYYFHDDFFVDGDKIKGEDILLFSRGNCECRSRLKGWEDAKKSPYAHFDLRFLSLGIIPLFSRIIPKYIISGSWTLLREIRSVHFSLYWSIYSEFIYNGLPYEKVFSNFEILSELGHNYYSTSHIVEAIVCQNHGAKYYLMHWSDFSMPILSYFLSFLGCDGFLLWGNIHSQDFKGNRQVLIPSGYVFKRFIKKVASNKDKVLSDMGIDTRGKVISFFDESFGGSCAMTEENFVAFWKTILKVARQEQANTIVVKPKDFSRYKLLSNELKREFFEILNELLRMKNVHIIDEKKWSFVEAIGISDITVTQGMTSSATIAIVCGIEGLYLDQVGYGHLFAELFKDKIVFDDSEKLVNMIHKIVMEQEFPHKNIPEKLLREFDEYADDRGIDLFRDILSGSKAEL